MVIFLWLTPRSTKSRWHFSFTNQLLESQCITQLIIIISFAITSGISRVRNWARWLHQEEMNHMSEKPKKSKFRRLTEDPESMILCGSVMPPTPSKSWSRNSNWIGTKIIRVFIINLTGSLTLSEQASHEIFSMITELFCCIYLGIWVKFEIKIDSLKNTPENHRISVKIPPSQLSLPPPLRRVFSSLVLGRSSIYFPLFISLINFYFYLQKALFLALMPSIGPSGTISEEPKADSYNIISEIDVFCNFTYNKKNNRIIGAEIVHYKYRINIVRSLKLLIKEAEKYFLKVTTNELKYIEMNDEPSGSSLEGPLENKMRPSLATSGVVHTTLYSYFTPPGILVRSLKLPHLSLPLFLIN
ncbi:hypothetical protein VP01_3763g1 [Puccinia sorghi]|uniref:Uncharacterized protein n=1 Tax=Puccinia sorghi TaxID=27349 RepID=A0A0L6UTR0_9BASI|nr:hypothetical protein VP01_3763g1 [Puccinia sorghi]